ncbi:ejaculatory bulb-specific protein 3-like [Zerene cesonia]|uniref:ejaculatory bulb-specific protein 3-like n=1 Tax=Zerene cesonia TaxID=33412 RepID=UPI0018E53FF5|nr:ejaculatory bulb-specific protein 3-like [Zerene cesonia]XP_038211139.1 ejaculatory bulb-specific protein 3-like [Zerene cesonia]
MTKLTIFLVAIVVVLAIAENEIRDIQDLDLVKLLQNERERKAVFACLMEQAPCGKYQKFKESITQKIKTKCKDCTPPEKERYNMFSQLLSVTYPDKLNALRAKYRP